VPVKARGIGACIEKKRESIFSTEICEQVWERVIAAMRGDEEGAEG
jgi:hypothetical protein